LLELAFFNPIQLMIVLAILLILFGPQKMPEIGAQLGRALRELKRSTQELTDALHGHDNDYHAPYEPPRYDDTTNYGTDYSSNSYNSYNNYNDGYNSGTAQTSEKWEAFQPEGGASTSTGSVEPERGDFASPALADAAPEIHAASGSVPRTRA
jgi:TatA/E family protein of Tat protein translocase